MLNKRHKIKLRELSKRVKNTKEMYDVTQDTVHDATAEIEELLAKFDPSLLSRSTLSTELAVPSSHSDLSQILNDILRVTSETNDKFENFDSDNSDKSKDPSKDSIIDQPSIDNVLIPGWAKKLKKEISRLCHPDMLAKLDIPEAEKERRKETLLELNNAIQQQDWDLVLVIGIDLDIFVDELPPMNQKRRVQKVFQRMNKSTVNLRETIAYQWSEQWGNTQFKVDIVTMFLYKKGLPLPTKLEIVKIVKAWESLTG